MKENLLFPLEPLFSLIVRKIFTTEDTGVTQRLTGGNLILFRSQGLILCVYGSRSSFRALSCRRFQGMMADIGSQHPENNILGNVGGVVGYAFEVACDQERVEGLLGGRGSSFIRRTSMMKASSRMRSTTWSISSTA